MPHALRFSVIVPPNVAWPEFLRRCRHVEELGFDALNFCDHFTDWTGRKGPWFELWTQLSAIAMATTRIRLATKACQSIDRSLIALTICNRGTNSGVRTPLVPAWVAHWKRVAG